MFDNIRLDFANHGRSFGSLGFWALVVYRFGRWRYTISNKWLRKPFSLLYHVAFKWIQIVTGIEIPCEVSIGDGLVIDHHGGIVVSGYARFGSNCRLRTGVVVGLARIDDPTAPVIGNNVDFGAGAKVLGRITIGDNVVIGANAVVIRDVPADHVAVGVPAISRPLNAKS